MPFASPIKFTFYDPATNEVVKEYNQWFIPWNLMKPAIRLIKSLNGVNPEDYTDEQIDEISSLVVEVFCHQFSVEDIKKSYASLEEMQTVLEDIGNRSGGLLPNPPPKGK
jgi:hypothetical protein